jgi:hypothetical protein
MLWTKRQSFKYCCTGRAVRSLCDNPSTLWVDLVEVQSAPCNKLQPLARGHIVDLIVADHPLSTIHCDEMSENT